MKKKKKESVARIKFVTVRVTESEKVIIEQLGGATKIIRNAIKSIESVKKAS